MTTKVIYFLHGLKLCKFEEQVSVFSFWELLDKSSVPSKWWSWCPRNNNTSGKAFTKPDGHVSKGQGVFALSQIADGVLNNLLQVRGTEISVSFLRAVRKSSFTRNDDHIITYLISALSSTMVSMTLEWQDAFYFSHCRKAVIEYSIVVARFRNTNQFSFGLFLLLFFIIIL